MVKKYFGIIALGVYVLGIFLFLPKDTDHYFLSGSTPLSAKVSNEPEIKEKYSRFLVQSESVKILVKLPAEISPPQYGDLVRLEGRFILPRGPTNPGGFNYPKYLRMKNIKGVFKARKLKIIDKGFKNPFKQLAFYLKKQIIIITRKTLPYPYSDLYIGLVFGEHGVDLPQELNDQYRKVGLTHLLVVSGSQVALLSGIMIAICQGLQFGRGATFGIVSVINCLFYFLTGGGASIFRAILMAELALGLKTMSRRSSFLHVFAFTALVMLLINPRYLFDVGAQLSFLATFALVFGVDFVKNYIPEGWPQFIRETLAMSIAPFIFTAPLLWAVFHQISPISIISNMLVISWIELLVPIGFFSTVIGFIFLPLTQVINNFSYVIMIGLNKLVGFLANVPFSVIHLKSPSMWVIVVIYGFLGLGLKNAKWLFGILIIVIWQIGWSLIPSPYLTVSYLDVGQGDAILIETPRGRTFLIDGGPDGMGRSVIFPVLQFKGINKLDGIILSHQHLDHFGGLSYVREQLPVGIYLDNKNTIEDKEIVLSKDLKIQIFAPFGGVYDHNENNNSLIVRVSYKEIDFLFTGDLEKEGEAGMGRYFLESEVLKLGHHGSSTSSTPAFLDLVRPAIGVACVGKYNRYRHPSKEVIERIESNGSKVYRTDLDGCVEIKTDGHELFVKTYGD